MYSLYFSLSVDIRVLRSFFLPLSKTDRQINKQTNKPKFPQPSQNIWLKIRVRNKIYKINNHIEFREEKISLVCSL
jgi:hypothetical protein